MAGIPGHRPVIGILIVMFFDEIGALVWTSLVSVVVLVVCWPLVRQSLKEAPRSYRA